MFLTLRNFLKRDEGSLSVEAVIILPVILVVFMATYTYFDLFRAKSQSLKANYAISDMLSRDDNILKTELKGAGKLFRYLTQSSPNSWVRATVVWCKDKCDDQDSRELEVSWSADYNQPDKLTTAKVRAHYNDKIPIMYKGEYLLMIETAASYAPPFNGEWHGVYPMYMTDLVVTKPRGAPKICYDNANCNPT